MKRKKGRRWSSAVSSTNQFWAVNGRKLALRRAWLTAAGRLPGGHGLIIRCAPGAPWPIDSVELVLLKPNST
ncbi:hypothetical protein [Nitrosomonas communis]|uniref:hypothetical protein n=1 Tax=Nitrosomonas communis TaxID=44574 RepID=UPI003D297D56